MIQGEGIIFKTHFKTAFPVSCWKCLFSRVEALRSLVALTDPQEGKLTQSQEKVSD